MDLGNSFNTTGDHRQALFCLQQSIIAGCNTFKDTASFSNPLPEDILLTYSLIRNLTQKAYILYSIYDDNKRSLTYLVNALNCQELAVKLIEKRIIDIDEEKSGLIMADLIRIPMNNTVSYAVLLYLKTGEKLYARKAWEYAEKSKMQVLSINTMKRTTWSGQDYQIPLFKKMKRSTMRSSKSKTNWPWRISTEELQDRKTGHW
jgi:uncharacterized protein YjhX (UPF0386 family)